MPCKDCLNRREFLAKSAAAAATFALIEGCGDGQIGGPSAPATIVPAEGLKIAVADYPGLASNNVLVRIQGQAIGVVRTGATTFVASSTVCTHEQCETNVRNNRYECPCHDSLFTAVGEVIRGPATRQLQRFATTFDAATGILRISASANPAIAS
jgi:Rieske Fe-S protein